MTPLERSARPLAPPDLGRAILWGALGVLGFSASLPATRIAVTGGLDPTFVGIGRAVVAGLLAVLVLWLGRAPIPPRRTWGRFLLVALGVVIGFPLLTAIALRHVTAADGAVVIAFLPAMTAVCAVVRAGERPPLKFWLAAGAGVACVVLFAVTRGGGGGVLDVGNILLLLAVVVCGMGYAEGAVLAREIGGTRVICWALVISLPVTSLATAVTFDTASLAAAPVGAWVGFAYVALVSMFLGFFAWYRGLAMGGIARIGQLQLAQPVLSLVWASTLLGESVTAPMIIAALAVLACVVMTQRAR